VPAGAVVSGKDGYGPQKTGSSRTDEEGKKNTGLTRRALNSGAAINFSDDRLPIRVGLSGRNLG